MNRKKNTGAFSALLGRIRDRYKNNSEFRRAATLATASLGVLIIVILYGLSKETIQPESNANGGTLSETQPEKTAPVQPDADSSLLPPRLPIPAPAVYEKTLGVPAERLNLTNWKIALPVDTGHAGSPDEIKQPEIGSYSLSPYFINNPDGEGVVFRAHAGGATTKNSKYPRSELREMTDGGRKEARWSSREGVHTMTVRQAITHLPNQKPELVAAQIHDDSDDIVMVRLENKRLFVEADGNEIGVLNSEYVLGTPYTVTITAERNGIRVYYDGVLKVTYNKEGADYYFKAGCYTQSNTERGDKPDAYGEVIIYDLKLEHT